MRAVIDNSIDAAIAFYVVTTRSGNVERVIAGGALDGRRSVPLVAQVID
jgi:hypothetical protein